MLLKINTAYPDADFVHTKESLKVVVDLINGADKLRKRKNAPAPPEIARATENARGVSAPSGADRDDESKYSFNTGRTRRSFTSRGKGKLKYTFEDKKAAGACKHCVKQGFNGFHLLWRPADQCSYNPKWKGYRHEQACILLGKPDKAKRFFSPSMGGYKYPVKSGENGVKSSSTEQVALDDESISVSLEKSERS